MMLSVAIARGAHIFQKYGCRLKILHVRRVTWSSVLWTHSY